MTLTREQLLEILGPPLRELEGEERNQVLLLTSFLEPIYVSNNQHCITHRYFSAGRIYYITYWPDDCTVEELVMTST